MMIVKNESSVIQRCLDQLVGIVDYISICDTGSTDDTVSIIQQWITRNKKDGNIENGTVHHHIWKNFGHNRTLSARSAQSWLVSQLLGNPGISGISTETQTQTQK